MPIAINTSRPPSTGTVPSTAAGSTNAPARATTTSRRGGRTARSRSPTVVSGGRQQLNAAPSNDVLPSAGSGDNPSSAAAAAAAAAKAFSNGGRSAWPEQNGTKDASFETHGSRKWPGEQEGQRMAYGQHPMRRYGYEARPFRNESDNNVLYGDRRYGGGQQQQRALAYEQQERIAAARYARGAFPPDYRGFDQRDMRSKGGSQQRSGGTSLILGGATPIHVPKTSSGSYDRQDRGGSAASVFRGRSDGENSSSNNVKGGADSGDEDSPQKILLSLRTPTTSFEDKGQDKTKKPAGLSLSPDDPPQIQNSHQNRQSDALFEPNKSPEGSKGSGSIDMAPSFTLFNQSFDSFGDTNYFHVDSSLRDDSFGMARTNSVENNEGSSQLLRRNSSGGNLSQPLMPTGSAALTIGYSPVNSFGNASATLTSRREPMVLGGGGGSARSSSPSQVLGIYRSYSGGGIGTGPDVLDGDPHLRLSAGSFGGQSYGRPYGDVASSIYYGGTMRSSDSSDRGPHFYVFLRKCKLAFQDCTFLLPGLKTALLESPLPEGCNDKESKDKKAKWDSTIRSSGSHQYLGTPVTNGYPGPTPQEIMVARRRVECSVCAFGGNLKREHSVHLHNDGGKDAIFRGKAEAEEQHTVTPSSSVASPKGSGSSSQARLKYEEALPNRYYENDSRLSWEFEESPPIEVSGETQGGKVRNGPEDETDSASKDSKERNDGAESISKQSQDARSQSTASPQPKMRYRCKLCGQPKQNHRCPFQQSLARSIGIMVYPAVNAFTAAEPGQIAAALSEMNNFIDIGKDGHSTSEETPTRPTPDRVRRIGTAQGAVSTTTQVTPESMMSNKFHSPSSFNTPGRSGSRQGRMGRQGSGSKKRSYSQVTGSAGDHGDLLFVDSMDLKQEQFRVVTQSAVGDNPDAFCYPPLPLPYAQRKKLSDNLFSLSNEVPKLTDECAQVLREAREKDLWDLAVAELMTQVIVILHCPDGDNRFEGLRQYLLTLGIAC